MVKGWDGGKVCMGGGKGENKMRFIGMGWICVIGEDERMKGMMKGGGGGMGV